MSDEIMEVAWSIVRAVIVGVSLGLLAAAVWHKQQTQAPPKPECPVKQKLYV